MAIINNLPIGGGGSSGAPENSKTVLVKAASSNISAGDYVSLKNDIITSAQLPFNSTTSYINYNYIACEKISENKFLVVGPDATNKRALACVVSTENNTLSIGTPLVLRTITSNLTSLYSSITKVVENKFLIGVVPGTTGLYACLVTVDDMTLTLNSTTTIQTNYNIYHNKCVNLENNKVLISYRYASYVYSRVLTINNNTITLGTAVNTYSSYEPFLVKINSSKVVLATGTLIINLIINGTTITNYATSTPGHSSSQNNLSYGNASNITSLSYIDNSKVAAIARYTYYKYYDVGDGTVDYDNVYQSVIFSVTISSNTPSINAASISTLETTGFQNFKDCLLLNKKEIFAISFASTSSNYARNFTTSIKYNPDGNIFGNGSENSYAIPVLGTKLSNGAIAKIDDAKVLLCYYSYDNAKWYVAIGGYCAALRFNGEGKLAIAAADAERDSMMEVYVADMEAAEGESGNVGKT